MPEGSSGVYLVSLTEREDSLAEALPVAPVSAEAVRAWLEARPELRVDGERPSAERLAVRLAALLLADEVVLYVGKATSLERRVNQYYSTPLGARRPHAGGHFLKTLSNIDDLFVRWSIADDPPPRRA